jgi:hypothetical protein
VPCCHFFIGQKWNNLVVVAVVVVVQGARARLSLSGLTNEAWPMTQVDWSCRLPIGPQLLTSTHADFSRVRCVLFIETFWSASSGWESNWPGIKCNWPISIGFIWNFM